MQFSNLVKRLLIDIFEFLAATACVLFLYNEIIPFAEAALELKMLNGATAFYIIYALFLFLLPIVMLSYSGKFQKPKLMRTLFYSFGAVIILGTIYDLITYRAFIGYTFNEGDPVFVNIMWNAPNFFGVFLSIVSSVLFFTLGKYITQKRRISYALFVAIVFVAIIVPFIYTFITAGSLPRSSWLDKAVYIVPEYLFLFVSFSICASSRELWMNHMWN